MKRLLAFVLTAFATMSIAQASLDVGDKAPVLTATTDSGEKLNLGEVYSKGYTLVYFYPKAGTKGCTLQGCSLRDSYEVLTKKGVTVIGVSTDTVEEQKKFRDEQHFPFPLIADTDKAVLKGFGQDATQSHASRQAFLVNKEGKIVWRDLKASTDQQAADVLKALASLPE